MDLEGNLSRLNSGKWESTDHLYYNALPDPLCRAMIYFGDTLVQYDAGN